jgi:hypothetical protein
MKKFAVTYATMNTLISNPQIREISPTIKSAWDSLQSHSTSASCSACAKRKKMNEVSSNLIGQLQRSSQMELDRIKKALGVDILVFPNGFKAIEL